MKHFSLILFSLFLFVNASAQHTIQGKVFDYGTKKPIENASVYINNTSIGMKTNDLGAFRINSKEIYKDLIISALGYEKAVIELKKTSNSYTVYLMPKENSLSDVTISFDRNAWKKWGDIFSKMLLGVDVQYSKGCEIVNPQDLQFYYDPEENFLEVTSTKTLIVKNFDLGYFLNIDIDRFKYSFIEDHLIYDSTINYEYFKVKDRKNLNVQIATNYNYYGSKQHFFRSLYQNTLKEEGFQLCSFRGVKNAEKERVTSKTQKRYAELIAKGTSKIYLDNLDTDRDSALYFRRVLNQDDFLSIALDDVKIDDFIKYDTINKKLNFNFPDTLLLSYNRDNNLLNNFTNRKKVDPENRYTRLVTMLFLTDDNGVDIDESGFAFNNVLFTIGDIGSRRFSRELPLSYDPKIGRKLE